MERLKIYVKQKRDNTLYQHYQTEKIVPELIAMTKPWLDDKGAPLCDEDLRLVSQEWTEKTWEEYLKTIEEPQSEIILGNYDRVLLKHESQISLNKFSTAEDDEAVLYVDSLSVKKALLKLTYQQRQLAELVYFKGLTITSAAEKAGVTRENASRKLARAMERIRKILSQRVERGNAMERGHS